MEMSPCPPCPPCPAEESVSVIEFLIGNVFFIWKEWPMPMTATTLNLQNNQFSFTGICPHCTSKAVFMIVAGPHVESQFSFFAVMQCQGCRKFILGCAYKGQGAQGFTYALHYPFGKPNDD